MGLSTYSKNTWLDFVLGAGSFTPPTTVYLSLHTADPGLTGANEINDGTETWYVRKAITFNDPGGGNSITQTAGNILFDEKDTGGSITATHYGIWDAETNGNFLGSGNPTDQAIVQNAQLVANTVKMTVNTGGMTSGGTTNLADEMLNHIFRNVGMTDVGDVFGALFTASPGDVGDVSNEVAASVGYSRQALTFGSASGGVKSSSADTTWGVATGAGFGTVSHFAIGKAGTRAINDLLFWAPLDANETVNADDSLEIASGDIDVTL